MIGGAERVEGDLGYMASREAWDERRKTVATRVKRLRVRTEIVKMACATAVGFAWEANWTVFFETYVDGEHTHRVVRDLLIGLSVTGVVLLEFCFPEARLEEEEEEWDPDEETGSFFTSSSSFWGGSRSGAAHSDPGLDVRTSLTSADDNEDEVGEEGGSSEVEDGCALAPFPPVSQDQPQRPQEVQRGPREPELAPVHAPKAKVHGWEEVT